MKTKSSKAKGRLLQLWVKNLILSVLPTLDEDDVRSTPGGVQGEDIQLSSAARKILPLSIECKSRESVAVYAWYKQAKGNTPKNCEPILVIKQNREKPLVIVDAEYFFRGFENNE